MNSSVTDTVRRDGHYWDQANQCYWETPYVVGDTVQYKGGGGSYGGSLVNVSRGVNYVIEGISIGTNIVTLRNPDTEDYHTVYTQKLHLKNVPTGYAAKHFSLVTKGPRPMPILQIAADRPCLVFELDTDAATGKLTVKDAKKAKAFDSMTLAKAWVEEQIVTSIRENNVYPKYSVYEERFVGRAEKPPVVFE